MSLTTSTPRVPPRSAAAGPLPGHPRRVRHQARDAVAVMAFSAATSLAVAGGLLLIAQLGR